MEFAEIYFRWKRKTRKIVYGHSLGTWQVPTPTPPLGSAVYWLSSGVVELCLATRNMASSEEGSTHTRTIQKRAKKTQDQACQFDASLLEGERHCVFFFAYTHSVFLGRWTQYLCDVTSVTQSKIFSPFRIFQRKLELVKLATRFLGKENWNWLILFHERFKRPRFEGLNVILCSPARCVLCRRNLSVRAPRGPSDFEWSREFVQWCVLSRFHS